MTCRDSIPFPRGGKLPANYFTAVLSIPLRFSRGELPETILVTPEGRRWMPISWQEARWIARHYWPLLDVIAPYDNVPRGHYLDSSGLCRMSGRAALVVAPTMDAYLRAQGIPARGDLLPREARAA